jgi:uncharacterized integral membrane protein
MTLLRRLLAWLVLLPVSVAVVAWAVINRAPVTVAWNPLEAGVPGHGAQMPLFVFAFLVFVLGVLAGGFAVWNTQRRWRRSARERRAEAQHLRGEVAQLKQTVRERAALPAPR